MEDNFLPSFVKRKGRITKYQIDNLQDIGKYRFNINDPLNKDFSRKTNQKEMDLPLNSGFYCFFFVLFF